jgi:hypothetical protein
VAIKKWVGLMVVVGICLLAMGINYTKKSVVSQIVLNQQTQVFDEAQFLFKPIYEFNETRHDLKLLISVTSYIYPELLTLDYGEMIVLEVGDQVWGADTYDILETTPHSLVVQLIFKLDSFDPSAPFGVRLFTYSDNEVRWN